MSQVYYALVGAPNCGKTVLFNALTGAHAKVANYPGVTVDRREGRLIGNPDVTIIDLPGTYSLRVTSPDEAVTRKVLFGEMGTQPDAIIAVADATNLRMTLRLVLELKTLGLPMVVSLNLSDIARKRGVQIETAKLAELLGVPVVETVAISQSGTEAIRKAIAMLPKEPSPPLDAKRAAEVIDSLDSRELYEDVTRLLRDSTHTHMTLPAWHTKLDDFVLHPVWGVLLLLLILLLVFQAVYTWSAPLMDSIEGAFTWLGEWVAANMPPGILSDLIVNGIIAGIGSVLVFLPQITILFAFILLLEDSGYLPRAAFLMDNLLAKSGLSGRAFIPLLSSFACAVPAVMSARTIQDPRERLVTISVAPLLTCSARLPVYALIIAAVIPQQTVWGLNLQGLVLFILYLAGILSAGLVAFVMKKIAKRHGRIQQFPLLMELPTYRLPNFKNILLNLWDKVRSFLKRAGTIIFALSVVLWALVSFPGAPENAKGPAIDYSFAGMIGRVLQPIFEPIGFTWQMTIAMIPGVAAREVVVAALGTVYAVSADSDEATSNALIPIVHNDWGLPTAFAFLAWYVYAPMCLATIAVIRRETRSPQHTALIVGYLLVLAYAFSFIVYRLTLALTS
ncbi:MAG: ferrous iron transport protein B [Neisseria sp.]|uniref:ferrous iron transport protein B n=1 Tax=Neisseria sp. TaxID=192066 RepID=UPI0026DDC5D1|nr:ferrous iron transport protein B [Neisseria sp.]MDO4249816.1 ferrous iron transport protein B [Neisseria sp.]